MKKTAWAAIRKTEGREWIDTSTLRLLPDDARFVAEETDKAMPHWASENRLMRIAEVTIEVVK